MGYLDTYVLISFVGLTFIAVGVAFVGFLNKYVSEDAAVNMDRAVLYTSVGAFIIWRMMTIKIVHGEIGQRYVRHMGPSPCAIDQSEERLELIQSIFLTDTK